MITQFTYNLLKNEIENGVFSIFLTKRLEKMAIVANTYSENYKLFLVERIIKENFQKPEVQSIFEYEKKNALLVLDYIVNNPEVIKYLNKPLQNFLKQSVIDLDKKENFYKFFEIYAKREKLIEELYKGKYPEIINLCPDEKLKSLSLENCDFQKWQNIELERNSLNEYVVAINNNEYGLKFDPVSYNAKDLKEFDWKTFFKVNVLKELLGATPEEQRNFCKNFSEDDLQKCIRLMNNYIYPHYKILHPIVIENNWEILNNVGVELSVEKRFFAVYDNIKNFYIEKLQWTPNFIDAKNGKEICSAILKNKNKTDSEAWIEIVNRGVTKYSWIEVVEELKKDKNYFDSLILEKYDTVEVPWENISKLIYNKDGKNMNVNVKINGVVVKKVDDSLFISATNKILETLNVGSICLILIHCIENFNNKGMSDFESYFRKEIIGLLLKNDNEISQKEQKKFQNRKI